MLERRRRRRRRRLFGKRDFILRIGFAKWNGRKKVEEEEVLASLPFSPVMGLKTDCIGGHNIPFPHMKSFCAIALGSGEKKRERRIGGRFIVGNMWESLLEF